ncbi:MAG: UDP-N-acetylglucosamine--N-acetylmuramyl-(pentapeptide) pyrophosphoryl-undecaprenol N-acetylglucosamine transferase [Armatimonadetes bacterium]|nr:UDP-N-acetylglucosamine--N-acetylmuramyl-(pentapeptide) pyrophosphoryl-undecaprenol N-acetylglucosamine transferase [Armatimonadota bacterium]
MSTGRVMLAGGGSAGHSIPCVAVAEAIAAQRPECEFLFVGSTRPVDRGLFERLKLPHVLLDAQPFPYRPSWALVRSYMALRRARGRMREIIAEFRPDAVFSTGGYVSAPVVTEAARARVPVVLHASDAKPGRANLYLARHTATVTVAYQAAAAFFTGSQVVVAGQPLRRSILHASRERGRAALGAPPEATVLLALGGSQGADSINRAVLDSLPHLLSIPGLHVVHFTGAAHEERVREAAVSVPSAKGAAYRCHGYVDEPGDLLAAGDLVVSRCGSSSLAEFMCLGLPCIAVPLAIAGGHQRYNVQPLLDEGAAVLVDNERLSGAVLAGVVSDLLADPQRLTRMSRAARSLAAPQAADRIADLLVRHLPSEA